MRGVGMKHGEELVNLLKMAGYSQKAIDYFLRQLNVGVIEGAEASESHMGLCGDSMKIYLKIEDGVIVDAKFQAIGCAGAFASGSALTELVKGKTIDEAEKLTEEDLLKELGGLPGPKLHCARLALDALKKSIKAYRARPH